MIDEAGRRAGVSRGQAFEDFLTCAVCALSAQQMEEEYLATVRKGYDKGKQGRRGIDSITQAFATLVHHMEENRDVIGDVFQGGVTYGEAGQYLTPISITMLMSELTTGLDSDEDHERRTVCDPCCGSGRFLLSVAEKHPHWFFVGQDVDLRCVKMTAINLGLRKL